MINEKYQSLLTDDEEVSRVAKEMLDTGYVALENFLDTASNDSFHAVADNPANKNKKAEQLQGTVIHDFAHSDELMLLSQRLYDARCAVTGEKKVQLQKEKQMVGIPYKDGREGAANKVTAYHYDGAYINFLLPLVLPEDQSKGDGNLVMFPNLRRKYPAILVKIISRLLRHSSVFRRWYGKTEVVYNVDTMYIFFGDLSFHGVEPISNGERIVVTVNSHW